MLFFEIVVVDLSFCAFAHSVISLFCMKGKSQSKTIPVSGDQRTRLSLRDKRRIIAWRTEGKSREDVQKLLCPSGTDSTKILIKTKKTGPNKNRWSTCSQKWTSCY